MEINEGENIFDKLRELAGQINGNFNIMEEQVDIKLQMEYFKYSKKVKKDIDKERIIDRREELFNIEKSLAEKKHLLSQLASVEDVKAFRAIEKYLGDPDLLLKEWALMAFQESKMMLESSLLDENQVFISTGLGGRGTKLRYFMVLFNKSGEEFTTLQQKIIHDEFAYTLKQNDSEIEEVEFSGKFSSILMLIPISATIHTILKSAIDTCNEYGDFLKDNFLITNVKKLSPGEIKIFIEKTKNSNNADENMIDLLGDN